MKVTIKELANEAGVSIATVSHVINKTRYVSPELIERVEKAIEKTGYSSKKLAEGKKRIGAKSVIAVVVPVFAGTLHVQLVRYVSEILTEKGYLVSVYYSESDERLEKNILMRLCEDKNVRGIILSPCNMQGKQYEKVIERNIPLVLLERKLAGVETDCVVIDNEAAIYKAVRHLVKYGHEKIGILLGNLQSSTVKERLEGYKKAIEESDILFDEKNVLVIRRGEEYEKEISDYYKEQKPSAIITSSNYLTLALLQVMKRMGLECPDDVSVVGFGDEAWCELVEPPLTTIRQDARKMALYAAGKIVDQIEGRRGKFSEIRVKAELTIRKSTQMIGRGPFGERAFSPDDITFTDEEREQIREGDFKVAIAFHYGGTAWKNLHESGIRDTLEKFGITVVSVTDAHFNPELQITQLEGIGMQDPDVVIAIPADDTLTAPTFKKLSARTKLIFMSNVPEGFGADDYVTCVSVNERENGRIAADLMGEYFKGKRNVKVGFITHGASFYGTYLRDMVAIQVICENYSNIEIASVSSFINIEDAYRICRNMIRENPDIEALYICWDQPALRAIRALEEMGRDDIAIFTYDLDEEIGEYLVQEKYVKGMGTQRPYEQGVAVGLATAKALLGNSKFKYVGVSPYTVQKYNFLRAWKDIMHEPVPEKLKNYLKK